MSSSLSCSFLVVFAISFQKQPMVYSLLINPSSLFSIQEETGEISLTRTLDYESDQRRFLLMVRASEEPGSLSTAIEVGFIRKWCRQLIRVHALKLTRSSKLRSTVMFYYCICHGGVYCVCAK